MTADRIRRLGYVRQLDGVRAMAIALVICSHSIRHAEGGGIGVHVFFVLSGFLITSLLLQERAGSGRISFPNFYIRRALRLLPALLLLLVVVALLPNVYIDPARDGSSASRLITIPITLFYGANFANGLGLHMGYLAHAWSLSIEEQFYVLWPIAMVWLVVRGRFITALLVLIPAFAVLRFGMAAAHVKGTIDWLTSHADQLLIGSLLAWWVRAGLPDWIRSSAAGAAALGTLLALTLTGSYTHQGLQGDFGLYGGLTLTAIAAAVLIAHLVAGHGPLLRVFGLTPLVWLGRVSYGVYLFHFPVFQYVAHQRLSSQAVTIAVEYTATAALVVFSWFAIERPALKLKPRFGPRIAWPHPPLQKEADAATAQALP